MKCLRAAAPRALPTLTLALAGSVGCRLGPPQPTAAGSSEVGAEAGSVGQRSPGPVARVHAGRILRIVDHDGAPITTAFVTIDSGAGTTTFAATEGLLELPPDLVAGSAALESSALQVHAEGYAPLLVPVSSEDRVVTLAPSLVVRMRAAEPYQADTGAHGFWLRLRRASKSADAETWWCTELPFKWGDGREHTAALPGPGRYELDVLMRLRWGTMFGSSPADRYVPTGVFVEVAATTEALVIDVPDELLRIASSDKARASGP